jgi:hypothetical protein
MSAMRPLALLLAALATGDPVELRGVWITAEDLARLDTRGALADAMERLGASGLDAVFPPLASERLPEVLFEAHRRGLEVLPWLDPGDAAEDAAARTAIDACRESDLDGLVVEKWFDRIRRELAALDPELAVVAPARLEAPGVEVAWRLPAIAEGAPSKPGDVLFGLASLLDDDAQLARSLREGPFAEDARPPWRKAAVRRRPVEPIEAFAGGGVWTWTSPQDGPRFLAMDGGETGHATWTFEPPETGTYALYAWIPAREDLAAHASFKIASAGSSRTIGIDTADPRKRGWIYLGDSRLVTGKPIEVARLDAEEQDATKISAAGPLLVIRSFRKKPA